MKKSMTRRQLLAASASLAAGAKAFGNTENVATRDSDQRTARAYQIGDQNGLDSLLQVDRQIGPVGPADVLIRTRAAALNYRDIMILEGRYGALKPTSRVLGGDGAGEIVAVGEGVVGLEVGDRVTAPHLSDWIDGDYDPTVFAGDIGNNQDGWLSEIVRLPGDACVKLPENMSFESAAALGAAGITAWRVLVELGNVKAGDTVLTLGTGGVSILTLQLATMHGANVAITSSSDEKLKLARKLGASVTINYRRESEWEKQVVAQTGGANIVVETVGLQTLNQSLASCAPNARIGFLGGLGGTPSDFPSLSGLILKNAIIQGITSGSRKMQADMIRACQHNKLVPHIDRIFEFDEAKDALIYLSKSEHVGKVVVTFGDD
jgi:NADPH:quinone reductase-like Zn-dependent oxidoreductase